ncbi:DCC1-like thiol-disulfide oxidoreductase family protein [Frigidibacter sp. RF13]|uniref:thiol-disulfide oxidoreductase DCC family protein n=1 Tax=Frigidibacter sp. RF13 TaxID=2997340 RepID=UPI00226D6DA0|nr:DCC1-like thiol-disulfide oxidoreductase family protein [Frigidibacter sp. RF13]MCY1128548.1 DCC1-like thiol-disulfide oxidoreductase family protein [Frigidibacter sp. RF13]
MTRATSSDMPDADGTDLILFDGTCVFCSGFARLVARHDRAGRFRFVTAHSPTGQALYRRYGLDPEAMETNIVLTGGRAHLRMRAFTAAMRRLGWPWKAAAVLDLLPLGLADRIYGVIARNRYVFGRRDCPLPSADLRARLIE